MPSRNQLPVAGRILRVLKQRDAQGGPDVCEQHRVLVLCGCGQSSEPSGNQRERRERVERGGLGSVALAIQAYKRSSIRFSWPPMTAARFAPSPIGWHDQLVGSGYGVVRAATAGNCARAEGRTQCTTFTAYYLWHVVWFCSFLIVHNYMHLE